MTMQANHTIQQTYRQPYPGTILQRIANKDRNAVAECIDTYGCLIWALAKKLTASTEDAEAATQDIFTDIWQFATCGDQIRTADDLLITQIATRRLIKRHLTKSTLSVETMNDQGETRGGTGRISELSGNSLRPEI